MAGSTVTKGNGRTITFADTNDWGTGFTGTVTVANTSATAINGWTISFDLANDIINIWNAQIISHVGTRYTIAALSYNGAIAAGGSSSFGFQANGGNPVLPTQYTFNGVTIGGGLTPPPPLPSLAIGDASVTETGVASLNKTFTIKLSSASTTPVTVKYHTADGTAHAATDYNAASGTLTFAAGQTSQTITIATHPGTTGSLNYSILLDTPSGATIADASGAGTIVNAAPIAPVISVAGATVYENGPSGAPHLLPAGFLSTKGNQIIDASCSPVKIAAVNWFGVETNLFAPHGLWAQNYQSMMRQMVSLGFNAIRLPFSLQALAPGSVPNGIDFGKNPGLQGLSALQILDKIVAYAGQIGMKIILDDHRSAAGSGPNGNGLWYDSGYTEAQWISTWKTLASHYAGNSTIIGADLLNEPHGAATWGDGSANDWAAAATRAGNAVQSVNANWLIFVEGIEQYQGNSTWWGGNLMGAQAHPITLSVANKLVYSPHDYPASVYAQSWFLAPDYPNNLPAVWDKSWGYLFKSGTAPVLIGEFGSKLATTSDQQWMAKLVAYMNKPGGVGGAQGISWAYWDWNPNSSDTGGILKDDWATVDQTKLNAISPAMYYTSTGTAPTDVAFTVSLSEASASAVRVHYATTDGTAKAGVNYVAMSGDLTFAPGETAKIVSAHLLSHAGASGPLQFLLSLTSPSGGALGTASAAAILVYPGGSETGTGTGTSTGTGTGTTTAKGAASLNVDSDWGTGLTATVTVSNAGTDATHNWTVEVDTADLITSVWNGKIVSHTGNAWVIGNADYNADIPGKGSTSFGFQASSTPGAAIDAHLLKIGV